MAKFLKPAFGKLNSRFGYRIHPIYGTKKKHEGIDISRSSISENIFVPYDGVVTRVKWSNRGYGNYVTIRHNVDGVTYNTLFAHLSNIKVKQGQSVKMGEVLGVKGTTGASTGVHLHFEVHKGPDVDFTFKRNIDPLDFIDMNEDPTSENIKKRKVGEIIMSEIDAMLDPNKPKTAPGKTSKEDYEWARDNKLIVRDNANSVVTAQQLSSIMKRLYDKIMDELK